MSGNRCPDMVLGNRCRETGVWIWFWEIGVGKQVSGNRCLDSFWIQVSGNRCLEFNCLETDVWIQLSLRIEYPETDVLISNLTRTYGEKVSGYKCPGNRCLGNRWSSSENYTLTKQKPRKTQLTLPGMIICCALEVVPS